MADFHDQGHGYDVFGLHPPTRERFFARCAPIYERYFRVRSAGTEYLPAEGPAILVANHAGVLPVDGAMLTLDVGRRANRILRPIADRFVPKLPLVGTAFARCGVVSGTRANVEHLLGLGAMIAIFPEGVSGPAKRFRERYQLQRWNVGFAELAIRHRAPIIPVVILGAEESWPLAAKLRVRWFGSPYLPIPAWPVPLPTHYRIQYGPPVRVDRGHPAADAEDPAIVGAAAAHVRHVLAQQLEDTRLVRRGIFR